jgi:hypothetical protein
VVGQVASISLAPSLATTGESLNFGQIGQGLSATATDCKGNAVSVKSFTFSSTSSYNANAPSSSVLADINPASGQVCAGTWNRNTGGGVPDYTTCTAPSPLPSTVPAPAAYVTATANGAVSNAIAIYVHPVVTGIVLGGKTANCSVDPGTDCCPNSTIGTPVTTSGVYTGNACVSQNATPVQLVARVYQGGTTTAANNITCEVGHISYAPLTGGSIVSIDVNGAATANQPGSTEITATIAQSSTGSNAGFFSTCPPKQIVLSAPTQPNQSSVSVLLNNALPLTSTVYDTNGNVINGLNLEYNSTAPTTIPASVGSVTPAFPGSATITAVCQPSTCNPAPFNQLGYLGNGEPLTSNGITVNTSGTSSTVLYMGSTSSQYVEPYDFTINTPSSPIKLPYVPNSMVINQSGTNIYLGSAQGLMTISTAGNTVTGPNQSVTGTVLSVSPDGTKLVVSDPLRAVISIVSSSGNVETTYGGIATSAQWTPDSQLVYITTGTAGQSLLTYSLATSWETAVTDEVYTSAVVTVPNIGAYFSGSGDTYTEGRSYCSNSVVGAGSPPTVTNTFAPLMDKKTFTDDVLTATTNGTHILGAHAVTGAGNSVLNDLQVTLPTNLECPVPPATAPNASYQFTSTGFPKALPGVNATAITGVVPASNSEIAFVTYSGSGGVLPAYYPAATGAGTLTNVTLQPGATAPLAGVFSTDNFTFYVGTAGDNQVHQITLTYPLGGGVPAAADTLPPLAPALPASSGSGTAPVNLIVQYPKASKS